jgi:hypothetical protein
MQYYAQGNDHGLIWGNLFDLNYVEGSHRNSRLGQSETCPRFELVTHLVQTVTCLTAVFVKFLYCICSLLPFIAGFLCTVSFQHKQLNGHLDKMQGTRWRSWLMHFPTSQKVAGWIPDGVIRILHWLYLSGRLMTLSFKQRGVGLGYPLNGRFNGPQNRRKRCGKKKIPCLCRESHPLSSRQ